MKTQIKSLIIICTLGLVGVLNANATSSYKTSCVAGTLEEQNYVKSENLNSTGFVFNEVADAAIDYQMEAQMITKWIADNEEAKTIQKLIDRGIFISNDEPASFVGEANLENLNSAEFDYQLEAQLITKLIADNEEAKTIQKLIDRGIFVSNHEMVAFAGEARYENLNSAEFNFNTDVEIDYQLEAQLITRLIADKEEANTIQKLIDEGKLVENK